MNARHWLRFALLATLTAACSPSVSPQNSSGPTEADWRWIEKYFPLALDKLLPLPSDRTVTIAFRVHRDFYNNIPEYSFVFYPEQLAVRTADGESIYQQLLSMHMKDRAESFEEAVKRVKVKESKLNPESCPQAWQKHNELLQLKFQPQRGNMIFLHPVVHELRIQSGSRDLSLELYDHEHAFVKWFWETRKVLDGCVRNMEKSAVSE